MQIFIINFYFFFNFLNTPDPQTTAVIKKVENSINMKSSNEFILPGDQIVAINSTSVSDSKDINLRACFHMQAILELLT